MLLTKRLHFREDEELIEVVRRSALTVVPQIALGALVILLAFFFVAPLLARGAIGAMGFALLLVIGSVFALRALWFWYWTAFVITSIRIVDVHQARVFHRSIAEARYDRIEDISVHVRGIMSTLFRLGDVRVQTLYGSAMLELCHVRRPERVHQVLSRLQHDAPQAGAGNGSGTIALEPLSEQELTQLRERIDVELERRRHGAARR